MVPVGKITNRIQMTIIFFFFLLPLLNFLEALTYAAQNLSIYSLKITMLDI